MLFSCISIIKGKSIVFHEEEKLYFYSDVPISFSFTTLYLLNRPMGTQIVCQDSVWTVKICMGSVCFDKLSKTEFTECRSVAEIMFEVAWSSMAYR